LKQNYRFATAFVLLFALSTSKRNGKRLNWKETAVVLTEKRNSSFGGPCTTESETKAADHVRAAH